MERLAARVASPSRDLSGMEGVHKEAKGRRDAGGCRSIVANPRPPAPRADGSRRAGLKVSLSHRIATSLMLYGNIYNVKPRPPPPAIADGLGSDVVC